MERRIYFWSVIFLKSRSLYSNDGYIFCGETFQGLFIKSVICNNAVDITQRSNAVEERVIEFGAVCYTDHLSRMLYQRLFRCAVQKIRDGESLFKIYAIQSQK